MADIFLKKLNNVHAQVECEPGIAMELFEHFSYYVDGYQWSPKYKYGQWDGMIRDFNRRNQTIRFGLHHELREWARARNYTVEDDGKFGYTEFSMAEGKAFVDALNLPAPYNNVHEHQMKGFVGAVRENRCVRLIPTAGGKSLVIYLLARYYNKKTLIIVPTIGLVNQMVGDFYEYGYKKECHRIMGGEEKYSPHKIVVSTWQSIYKEPRSYFDQYEVIIGDECHLFSAQSLTGILDKSYNARFRFGFTGTLTGAKVNERTLTGMFGKIHKVVSTAVLTERGIVAPLKIKILLLKHSEESRKALRKATYQKEISHLISSPSRNKFIKNLALSLEGNTLILFRIVDHGKYLYEIIKRNSTRPVYFIAGETDVDEREEIRAIVERESDAIIVASKGTTSTGTNMKRLHNVIFAHPSKSKVNALQSIGRALRNAVGKTGAVLYDIADDLRTGSWKNHTLNHLFERLRIYKEEQFPVKIYELDLKD